MTKTREKKVIHSGVTAETMELAFADYARADARTQKINATMDIEMTKIREKYADELGKLSELKEKSFDIMQTFAMENKTDLFSKKKSLETVHGVLGFRTGTPKLKTLKGFTRKSVTNLLKEFLPAYVRTIDEPDKERLIADRDFKETSALFTKVGIEVVQDESFFVEPKKEEL
jgi:phage host-nuclease inhibitor protein Gam